MQDAFEPSCIMPHTAGTAEVKSASISARRGSVWTRFAHRVAKSLGGRSSKSLTSRTVARAIRTHSEPQQKPCHLPNGNAEIKHDRLYAASIEIKLHDAASQTDLRSYELFKRQLAQLSTGIPDQRPLVQYVAQALLEQDEFPLNDHHQTEVFLLVHLMQAQKWQLAQFIAQRIHESGTLNTHQWHSVCDHPQEESQIRRLLDEWDSKT